MAGLTMADVFGVPAWSSQAESKEAFLNARLRQGVPRGPNMPFLSRGEAPQDLRSERLLAAQANLRTRSQPHFDRGQASHVTAAFNSIDRNHDGVISRSEFDAALGHPGAYNSRPPSTLLDQHDLIRKMALERFQVQEGVIASPASTTASGSTAESSFGPSDQSDQGPTTPPRLQDPGSAAAAALPTMKSDEVPAGSGPVSEEAAIHAQGMQRLAQRQAVASAAEALTKENEATAAASVATKAQQEFFSAEQRKLTAEEALRVEVFKQNRLRSELEDWEKTLSQLEELLKGAKEAAAAAREHEQASEASLLETTQTYRSAVADYQTKEMEVQRCDANQMDCEALHAHNASESKDLHLLSLGAPGCQAALTAASAASRTAQLSEAQLYQAQERCMLAQKALSSAHEVVKSAQTKLLTVESMTNLPYAKMATQVSVDEEKALAAEIVLGRKARDEALIMSKAVNEDVQRKSEAKDKADMEYEVAQAAFEEAVQRQQQTQKAAEEASIRAQKDREESNKASLTPTDLFKAAAESGAQTHRDRGRISPRFVDGMLPTDLLKADYQRGLTDPEMLNSDSMLSELKRQQQQAIEEEDFDEAKRLKAEIAKVQARTGQASPRFAGARGRVDPAACAARNTLHGDPHFGRSAGTAWANPLLSSRLEGNLSVSSNLAGAAFDALDRNQDGFVSRAEFNAAFPRQGVLAGAAFNALDRNRDGFVSRGEFNAAIRPQASINGVVFNALDRNHDGVVSREEFSAAFAPQAPGQQRMAELGRFSGGGREEQLSRAAAHRAANLNTLYMAGLADNF